jgi:NADH-quinone oxidoreductase subunit M
MCIAGMIFSSCAALAQIDVKKIIAYSSIGHMALVVLGMLDLNASGLLGSCYMMISHGLVSSALFFSIGVLYKIYGTRLLIFYSSLAHFMPRFSAVFFFFSLSNMGFPGTAGFPPELLIFSSLVSEHLFLSIFAGLGAILTGVYSIWLLT